MITPLEKLMAPHRRTASRVAIRAVENYGAELVSVLRETLREFSLSLNGKTVLLKPNFVAHDPGGVINTHPAVVAAARDAFLSLGAREVIVGDGPATERDIEAIAEGIHLREYLGPLARTFVDLNLDDVQRVVLQTRASALRQIYLPKTVLAADVIVSMPKMKTHHWAGVTLSLKNMFGVVPGCFYGWPKNILHWAGITRSLLDINSTVRPDFAIVDGIVGMEGNGPIQGKPKPCGVLVLGDDPVAVDATCARIMGLAPGKIDHIAQAQLLLGHLKEDKIKQIGESIARVKDPFEVMPEFVSMLEQGAVD